MAAPVVTIREGQVKGKKSKNLDGDNFYSFFGIPYAQPPIGELRFKAPRPVEAWSGVRDATKEGPECPARHMLFAYQIGNEDNCLHLNVFTRQLPEENRTLAPVMVWIHGGGFVYGANRTDFYGPEYLMTEDIVLVCINYRLGVLGFLSLEDETLGVPGNAGLKDMVLALKWVQQNIKQFNGDPNNVTIFGESAGGAAVHYLYISPLAKGLFHKAIIQSGSSLNCWARGCRNGQNIAQALGYNETDEKKILTHLKGVSAQKIVSAQHKSLDLFTADTVRPYGPVVEKPSSEPSFLTEEPVDILKSGKFSKVPLIIGYMSKEGIFFNAVRKIIPAAKIPSDLETEVPLDLQLQKGSAKSKDAALRIQKFYYGEEKASEKNIEKTFLLKTDTQFLHSIHRTIAYQKLHGDTPIYVYRMSVDTSVNYFKTIAISKSIFVLILGYFLAYKSAEGMKRNFFLKMVSALPSISSAGAAHADDLGYLFKSFLSPTVQSNSIEEKTIKRFARLWSNFAKTGNPNSTENDPLLNNVQWQAVTKDVNHFLDIGAELKTGVNPDEDRMRFWDQFYS